MILVCVCLNGNLDNLYTETCILEILHTRIFKTIHPVRGYVST